MKTFFIGLINSMLPIGILVFIGILAFQPQQTIETVMTFLGFLFIFAMFGGLIYEGGKFVEKERRIEKNIKEWREHQRQQENVS